LRQAGRHVKGIWAIRQVFFTNAPKRRENSKREWKINTRIKTRVLWKSSLVCVYGERNLGVWIKRSYRKCVSACAAIQYVAILLHKLLFPWVGEGILL